PLRLRLLERAARLGSRRDAARRTDLVRRLRGDAARRQSRGRRRARGLPVRQARGRGLRMSLEPAVAVLRERTDIEPQMGLVLGSGLGGLVDELEERIEIPYSEIPGWPAATAVGHAGVLVLGTLDVVPVAAMVGRAHLYEGVSADEVAFGVRVLGKLGIRSLVVTNAAGGINPDFAPGQLVLISDHVNLQGASALVGPNDESLGPRFPD